MKYGETLRQRSVPQWAYQNVAYDSIKKLIKEHTTPNRIKAVSIPGQGDAVEELFENQLFDLLVEQHGNINLFVRSKSGEIDRRLDHLGNQLHNIQLASWPPSIVPARVPPSRLAKYGRIEEQASQAGEEIKLLSRFVTVQKTAFVKLLKKYKKWSRRSSLEYRWSSEVVSQPDSFTNLDLGPFFDHWATLLQEIRFAMGFGQGRSNATSASQSPAINPMIPKESSISVARRLHEVTSNGVDVDFDAAISSVPIGTRGSRAVYWVHPDQLVELQVLLLQYTRLAFPKSRPGSSNDGSSPVTRRSSLSIARRDDGSHEITNGMIVLDEPNEFALLQNSIPISDTEDAHSPIPTQAAMTLRWTSGTDLAVCLRAEASIDSNMSIRSPGKIKFKRAADFLDLTKNYVPSGITDPDSNNLSRTPDNPEKVLTARKWLEDHTQTKPLVSVLSKRSRFINLPNGRDSGLWCVLDTNVVFRSVALKDLEGKDWPQTLSQDGLRFPYAVLQVRQEGKTAFDLIRLLDESHLTERVRGFSLSAHAVWSCARPRVMTPPFWLPVLSGDIRKLPSANNGRRKRKTASNKIASSGGEDIGSSSTAADTGEESSSIAGNRGDYKRGRSSKYANLRKKQDLSQTESVRYWSEYDQPEDDPEEGYFIYVNPDDDDDDDSWIPFRDSARTAYKRLRSMLSRSNSSVTAVGDEESSPLLQSSMLPKPGFPESITEETSSSSSSSDEDETDDYLHPRTRYGTLAASRPVDVQTENDAIGILLASMISLFFAATLSIVLLVLSSVGRKRARGEIDIVVLAGSFISLAFAVIGLWGMLRRDAGVTRWMIGISIFAGVVIIDGVLAGTLVREILLAVK
ncbi:hypothetical protein BT63DRAFT_459338 [Microthyrium microscopicum]|uniref:SPX domain-containing protein n=1 Tax=Microthyrium microscopicum TaxID=703497 RepID=A0A6A6U1H5_9PEZI|nr:hypothetical protein BT63DRAFT_459338 [Microthyrium microscopicum]